MFSAITTAAFHDIASKMKEYCMDMLGKTDTASNFSIKTIPMHTFA